jgi:hypothetical protein
MVPCYAVESVSSSTEAIWHLIKNICVEVICSNRCTFCAIVLSYSNLEVQPVIFYLIFLYVY